MLCKCFFSQLVSHWRQNFICLRKKTLYKKFQINDEKAYMLVRLCIFYLFVQNRSTREEDNPRQTKFNFHNPTLFLFLYLTYHFWMAYWEQIAGWSNSELQMHLVDRSCMFGDCQFHYGTHFSSFRQTPSPSSLSCRRSWGRKCHSSPFSYLIRYTLTPLLRTLAVSLTVAG